MITFLGNFRKKKKANAVLESLTILIVLVLMGIVSVVTYMAFDQVNTDILADSDMNVEAQNISNDLFSIYPELFDNLFLFAFGLFILFLIVSTFFLDTHPIFFILTVIALISVFLVGMLLTNVYDDLMMDSSLASYANSFTYTGWIISNSVPIIIVLGFLIAIILYAKSR